MGLIDDIEGKGHEENDEHGDPPERHAKLGTGPDAGAPGSPADKAKKQHRDNLIIIVVGLLGVIVTFLIYRKNQAGATTAATTSAPSTSTGTVDGAGSGSDDYADQMAEQNGQAIAGLQTLIQNLGQEVTELQSGPGPTTDPSTQSTASALPWVGSSSMPNYVAATNATNNGEFTQIGTETNGQYSGPSVAGGVPLFGGAGVGFFQNFGLAGGPSPNYSGPVYVPTSDKEYVNYSGPVSGAPT